MAVVENRISGVAFTVDASDINRPEEACNWKDHPYIKDLMVSDNGYLKRKSTGFIYRRFIRPPFDIISGYKNVSTKKDSTIVCVTAVAEAFLGYGSDAYPILEYRVDIKNGDPTDIRLDNIDITRSDRRWIHAKRRPGVPMAVVDDCGYIYASAAEAGRKLCLKPAAILRVCRGYQKTTIGRTFRFASKEEAAKVR